MISQHRESDQITMTKKKIGELLIEDGLIDQAQLTQALEIQKTEGGFLGKILVGLGYVSEEQVADHLMEQGGYAYLPLGSYDIDVSLIADFPDNICQSLGFLPVDRIGKIVTIAVADDIIPDQLDKIKQYLEGDIKVFVTTLTELEESFKKYFPEK